MKSTKIVTVSEAIGHIKSGQRISLPLACALPQTLIEAMVADKDRLRNVELVSGIQFDYKYLADGLQDSFTFRTWQCTARIQHLQSKGTVKYIPMRQSEARRVFSRNGVWPIDVALLQVCPPDEHGYCSLGLSLTHALSHAREADLVIAEVNPRMPRVLGNTFVHTSEIDFMVETDRPLLEYPSPGPLDETSKKISAHAAGLIPDEACIEIGLGSIPEGILGLLGDRKGLRFYGMGVDGMADLAEKGAVAGSRSPSGLAPVCIGEMLGTTKLFKFVHNNPMVEGSPDVLETLLMAKIDNFTSVLGAIEVDLSGQVNAETIGSRQVSGIGGGFDFLQGAHYSRGGRSIITMTSTTPDGKRSKVVPQLSLGSVVTHPRHSVHYVVTEYGVADLRGKSLEERAAALTAIAHPSFREELERGYREGRR